jgi:CRISPR-associated protein Cas2
MKKQFVVVAYDIACDKRRRKIAKILEAYGVRMNFSVFECFAGPAKIREMKDELQKTMHIKEDSILYYYICKKCINKIERQGNISSNNEMVILI